MDKNEFWSLVDSSFREVERETIPNRCAKQAQFLERKLSQQMPEEILDFERFFVGAMDRAYREDLWAAAYIIHGGCSDETFQYFRAWLIGQGQRRLEDALADPESLASVPGVTSSRCEALLYVGMKAYEAVTGERIPTIMHKMDLAGETWKEADLPTIHPKLWKEFGKDFSE
jgi:hypothetical protein